MPDIQREVEELATTVGCPVLVEDSAHRPLWWSVQGQVDTVRMQNIMQRQPPPAAAAVVTRLGLPDAPGPVRTPAAPELDMAERWCVPIRHGRQLLGYLWVVDPDGKIGEDDLAPLVACARSAGEVMAAELPVMRDREERRRDALTRLAAAHDEEAAAELIRSERLPPGCLVAVNAPPSSTGWAFDGVSIHADPPAAAAFTSGRPVPLADLAVAIGRATAVRRAVAAGAMLTAPTWDALGGWHLIVAAPAELTPGRIHRGVDVLLAQKRSDLLDTARCVLDNGGDVTRSAEALHIHRTTLYYRLERIEALTGVNLRLAEGRDDLHLALQLAAYRSVD
ncbi:MAG TPA: helix-turn-helix domain-containing protein [Jatrophihabitans sp.]|uniref:PucR family transcriptional regulator n=1 Tax=Jatrophihabitans sp. TaxID=1932789 RepID=UPI002DFFFFC6|nr:helix-turn-helix domain-containing protein [Jatrophihabitans sp.]